jgi:hypothetical protein
MIFWWAAGERIGGAFAATISPRRGGLLFQKRVDRSDLGMARNQSAPRALDEQPAAHFPLPVLGRLSRA